jgi:hypothetical protein
MGQCHEIFVFRLSTRISFPKAPNYTSRAPVANLITVSLTLVANFPPVSTTLAKQVAKFAAGGKFATCVVDPVGHIDCEYLCEFSKKFETFLMGYSGARGKLIHEKIS